MILTLTDLKRYELELDNCVSVILAANRRGEEFTDLDLARSLDIDQATTDKLILKLQTDNIIQ